MTIKEQNTKDLRSKTEKMLNTENKELCYQVLQEYGTEAQMLMVIEECSELQKAICKSFRSWSM